MKERLFLTSDLMKTSFFLKDSKGYCLGTFNSEAAARAWCDENGYHLTIQKP
jgi:hypothetical protein